MSRATPRLRAIAKQLIGAEKPRKGSAERDAPATFRAADRLGPHLSTLMGRTGFAALLTRALVLAAAEVPWLAALKVVADGEIEGLASAQARVTAADLAEGEVVLLAQLLGLLVAFIGPALTARLIGQIWLPLGLTGADFDESAT